MVQQEGKSLQLIGDEIVRWKKDFGTSLSRVFIG